MRTNAIKATGYRGRANLSGMDLEVNGSLVEPNALVRVVVKLEPVTTGASYCIDSLIHSEIVYLEDSSRRMVFQPGLIPGIQIGFYWVYITMYDSQHPEGFAWGASPDRRGEFYDEPAMYLKMADWPVCG